VAKILAAVHHFSDILPTSNAYPSGLLVSLIGSSEVWHILHAASIHEGRELKRVTFPTLYLVLAARLLKRLVWPKCSG
jgi:hypothetical protein